MESGEHGITSRGPPQLTLGSFVLSLNWAANSACKVGSICCIIHCSEILTRDWLKTPECKFVSCFKSALNIELG